MTSATDPDAARFLGTGQRVEGVGGAPVINLMDPQQRYNMLARVQAGFAPGTQPFGVGMNGETLTGSSGHAGSSCGGDERACRPVKPARRGPG